MNITEIKINDIIEMSNTTLKEISINSHKKGNWHIYIEIDENGNVINAWTSNHITIAERVLCIHNYGTGNYNCNCDYCSNGGDLCDLDEDPEETLDAIKYTFDQVLESYKEDLNQSQAEDYYQ
jgi:hypothetical protein